MKVALIPLLYDENNFGGVLQFYALQKSIMNMGSECLILKVNDDSVLCKPKKQKLWKRFARSMLRKFSKKKLQNNNLYLVDILQERNNKSKLFKQKYYVETVNINDIDIYSFDAVICGSDQIWNPIWARRRCFLDFVPDDINKIIYAASMGCESMEDYQKESFKPLVERIDHISVREKSAKRILDEFIENRDISVQVDPTLLLLKNDWENIAANVSDIVGNKKYIFTYFLGNYSKQKQIVSNFAKKNNLIIVNIPFASGETVDNENFGDIQYINASPDEFIGFIKNAEYVFTDSFHGCVFSIIFEKEFFAYKRDNSSKMMGRIDTLLDNFKISGRVISADCDIDNMEKIDYSKKEKIHSVLRRNSLEFIKESLENGQSR